MPNVSGASSRVPRIDNFYPYPFQVLRISFNAHAKSAAGHREFRLAQTFDPQLHGGVECGECNFRSNGLRCRHSHATAARARFTLMEYQQHRVAGGIGLLDGPTVLTDDAKKLELGRVLVCFDQIASVIVNDIGCMAQRSDWLRWTSFFARVSGSTGMARRSR